MVLRSCQLLYETILNSFVEFSDTTIDNLKVTENELVEIECGDKIEKASFTLKKCFYCVVTMMKLTRSGSKKSNKISVWV